MHRFVRGRLAAALAVGALCLPLALSRAPQASAAPLNIPINHLVVIYQENWSFDSLYGSFPGANGLANAGAAANQVDRDGKPLTVLPQAWDTNAKPAGFDPRFPANLPVGPFDFATYMKPSDKMGDIVHRFYTEQQQIDGGKMDKFVAWSDNPGEVMGHFNATNMPEGKIAQQYVMADNFFHGAFGGSFLNHQFLICACAPTFPNAPASLQSKLDANGVPTPDNQPGKSSSGDGAVSPDGFGINTLQPVTAPHATVADPALLIPLQTAPTIGDRLSDKNVSWAWYSGGWADANAGKPDPLFQFHHQPFNYYANYTTGTQARADHLKDEKDFLTAAAAGTLPSVAFIKPIGADNEHPGYADLARGQQHVNDLIAAIQNSPNWKDTAIIVTYDEHGGMWDHVAPPKADKWGPGSRVPAIIVSPYAKRGFVDHTSYDTTSILKFIEARWDVAALGTRDAAANNLLNAFDFSLNPDTAPRVAGAQAAPIAPPKTGNAGFASAQVPPAWLVVTGLLMVIGAARVISSRGQRS